MRVAGIDCGTNSMRLLVAERGSDGTLQDIVRRMEIVRLGEGVDATGRLSPAALERAFATARSYAAQCQELGVAATRFVATSATRDASNATEFTTGIEAIMGIKPEVISGQQEAALSFAGAVTAAPDAPGPYVVVDIGGGSTEMVLGTSSPVAAYSMNIGCVRMAERWLQDDPPTQGQIAGAARDIAAALDEALAHVPVGRARTLIGVAGTATSVAAQVLDLDAYDPDRIHASCLPVDAVLAACGQLLTMTRAKRSRLAFMHPGRVDVIGSGALVWSSVISAVRAEMGRAGNTLRTIITSEHDILDGITASAAARS